MKVRLTVGSLALVGALFSTTACAASVPESLTPPAASITSGESDEPEAAPIAGPTPVLCDVPHSDADITALPGLVELVVKTRVTGPPVASGFAAGDRSELATEDASSLIGSLPHGLRIYSNVPPDGPSLPVGEYVTLLGTYDEAAGVYFTVGGDQGVYAVQSDGYLRQRCVLSPGQADQQESADKVSVTELLGFVTTSMRATAPQRAEAAQHRTSPPSD